MRKMPVVLSVGLSVGLGWFGALQAGDPPSEKRDDRREIRQDQKELGATNVAYAKLSGTIDRWVETNLSGDDRLARRLQAAIMTQ
ncbi:MAG: hypothetical protein AB1744_08435, partial [Candidatus Zixiibacteriota bacterium]